MASDNSNKPFQSLGIRRKPAAMVAMAVGRWVVFFVLFVSLFWLTYLHVYALLCCALVTKYDYIACPLRSCPCSL